MPRGTFNAPGSWWIYTDDQPVGSLASYDPEGISLPEPGWQPIDLAELWGANGRCMVNEFVRTKVLPPEEARVRLEECGVHKTYTDPMLRGGKTYFSFLKRLQDSGIIDFSLQPARENISIFFVTKKNGRLRMIVDARRSNAHFTEPDHVDLCTGDGLGMLEIGEGETLTIATADLKDAFYHLSLPEELRPLFCLPPVRAGDVGVKQIRGVSISRGMKITPRLAVVPMGWSWALYLCQSIHESLAEQSGLLEKDRLRDRRPPPTTDMAHTQYVDNMIVLGTSEDKVKEAYHLATEKLKSAGLQVHEEEYNKEGAKILGWEFTSDGGFKPSHHRAWKVRMAIRGLLQRGRSSANQMEKIVGHCAFVCLGRREAFSVFGDVYKFIQCHKHSSREVSLWRSVRKELQTFDGIIPLIYRDLRARWNTRVHAVDASEFGLGATVADFPYGFVRELGQYNERWRFRDSQGCNPRQHVLSEQFGDNSVGKQSIVFEDEPDTICQVEGFQNVPFSAVDREWRTVGKHVWWDQASLPVYEARPGLYAAKHALRNRASFGMKHLILTDSLTAACAFSRGRSSSFAMRRVCSQLAALALGTGSTFHFRWIPSEWNPADNPSRGIWSPSSPKRVSSMVIFRQLALDSPLRWSGSQVTKPMKVTRKPKSLPEVVNLTQVQQAEMVVSSVVRGTKQRKQARAKVRKHIVKGNGTQTTLEVASVSKACHARYSAHWEAIQSLVTQKSGTLKSVKQVDTIMAERLEDLYQDGEDISTARYMIASLIHFQPQLRSPGMSLLPRIHQSLKGWNKLAPSRSRLPVPWEVTALIAMESFKEKAFHFGLHILLMFMLYLRPSEALRLRVCDVIPPHHASHKAYNQWSIVLHPQELGIPSKTLEFDECLQLDLPYHLGLGQGICKFIQARQISQKRTIFNHTNADLTAFLDHVAVKLKLEDLGKLHPYRFRHGGASHDFNAKLRDLPAIQQRGRWKSQTSVRRYQKGARLSQLFSRLSKDVQRKCKKASQDINSRLQNLP